jgi:hypothetical protein
LHTLDDELLRTTKTARNYRTDFPSETPTIIYCDEMMINEWIASQMKVYRHINPEDMQRGVAVNAPELDRTTRFRGDVDCPYNKLFFVTPSTFTLLEGLPISFMDDDGQILQRSVGSSNRDSYDATMRWWGQLMCDWPSANALLADIDQKIIHPAY